MAQQGDFRTVDQVGAEKELKTLLREDRSKYDCLPCRVMGGGAFVALGVYSYFSGQNQLRQQQAKILKSGLRMGIRSRQLGVTGIAAGLVGVGVWRLIN